MKKRFYLLLPLLLPILLLFSCDKVKNPYVKTNSSAAGCPNPFFPSKTPIQKVLVEDYTGHRCVNCHSAAVTLEQIYAIYPQQVIGMAVHANFWAEPSPCMGPPSGVPSYAFYHYLGCPAAENYFSPQGFNFSGNPNGMVNRTRVSGDPVIGQGTWKSVVDTLVTKTPIADINIFTNYDNSTRKLCVSCKTTFLKSMTGTYNLSVLFIEDSIIDWQAFSGHNDSNYVFRNVLRDDINGSGTGFGEQIKTGTISTNDTIVKSYSYQVPTSYAFTSALCTAKPLAGSPCDYRHCYVLAFVFNGDPSSPTYREIIQVEEKKIQ